MQNDLISRSTLIEWLQSQKYITVDENSTDMSEEFENEHKWELSRNCFINKAIKHINEQPTAYSVESVVEQLGKRKKKLFDRCVHGVFDTIMAEVENIVRNGGKE